MKIAVTYENGQIFQHFGHTAQFKLYEVEDGKVYISTSMKQHVRIMPLCISTSMTRTSYLSHGSHLMPQG